MNPSIRGMNWTMGQMEQIRAQAEDERRERIQAESDETYDLQEKIWYYGFNENAKLYDAWMLAGPGTRTAYLEYCRAEWRRVCEEIVFAHKLAGLLFTV